MVARSSIQCIMAAKLWKLEVNKTAWKQEPLGPEMRVETGSWALLAEGVDGFFSYGKDLKFWVARLLHKKYAPKISNLFRPTHKSRSNATMSCNLLRPHFRMDPEGSYREILIYTRIFDDNISDRERDALGFAAKIRRKHTTVQRQCRLSQVKVSNLFVSSYC